MGAGTVYLQKWVNMNLVMEKLMVLHQLQNAMKLPNCLLGSGRRVSLTAMGQETLSLVMPRTLLSLQCLALDSI